MSQNNPNPGLVPSSILKVPLKEELSKKLPITKLQSRLGVAKVLSFVGDSDKVYDIMQKTSHTTRAYISNVNGLKGFVVRGIVTAFSEGKASGEFEKLGKYHQFNIRAVSTALDLMPNLEEKIFLLG